MITSNPDSRSPIPDPFSKRGSALLIVLGMIAFLVISAVAFSAYMRYSRLPSSYLRRTSASRQLVKAALAEAIDQIDIALGNDPYPYALGYEYNEGSDYTGSEYDMPRAADSATRIKARRDKRNFWRSHCFIGTNNLVLANETVSTLNLEALAYLPPALINEARYYSRHSAGARWHNFGFDAGRYAFFAVDVSDHIDVNRVFADCARTSADRGRITLSHVFENPKHDGDGSPTAEAWDQFITDVAFGKKDKNLDDIKDGVQGAYQTAALDGLPFVSLADLNLAINARGDFPDEMSPFCWCVENGKKDFYQDAGDSIEMARQMAFVTDSYFPNTNTTETIPYDLAYSQPFPNMRHGKSDQMPVVDILADPPVMRQRMYDWFCRADMVSLYDYLDENDIPASLSLPTTERVPMICALQPTLSLDLKMEEEKKDGAEKIENGKCWMIRTYSYKLKLESEINTINGLFAFPFRHDKDANDGSYQVDYMLRIGLVTEKPGLRTRSESPLVVQSDELDKKDVANGVMRFYKEGPALSFSSVKTESDAVKMQSSSFNLSDLGNQLNDTVLFTVPVYCEKEVDEEGKPTGDWKEIQFDNRNNDFVDPAAAVLHPTGADGRGDGGFNRKFLEATVGDGGGPKTVKVWPVLTLTASVKSPKSNKIVDLVPASYLDDEKYNQIDNSELNDIWNVNGGASTYPIMTFVGDKEFEFGRGGGQVTVKVGGNTVVCPDPRWNFAPENFFTIDQAPDANWFISNCGVGKPGRDCDVFMFVSNQGYMQSVSEFAFLPRLAKDFGGGSDNTGNMVFTLKTEEGATFETFAADDFSKLVHGDLMWRTYNLFKGDGRTVDNLYDMGITCTGTGFRINPFTESPDVMMAALANTPYSWWAASTNYSDNAFGKDKLDGLNASDYRKDYAFCQMNNDTTAYFCWKDLRLVAENLMDAMRRTDGKWWEGFASLDWDGENSDFCGAKFANGTDADTVLKDVDRKFLYGYWRDCFAARQQLFLVFVRAEPTLMGAGSANAMPPQLGARAVALVWRDPSPTKLDTGSNQPNPHQTRVLFYRQFD